MTTFVSLLPLSSLQVFRVGWLPFLLASSRRQRTAAGTFSFSGLSVTQGRGQSGRVLQDCAVRRRDLLTEAKETYVTKDSGICRRQSGSSRLCLLSAACSGARALSLSSRPCFLLSLNTICVSMFFLSFSVSPSDPALSSPWLRTCVGREILIPKSCKRSCRLLKTQSGVFRSGCGWRKKRDRARTNGYTTCKSCTHKYSNSLSHTHKRLPNVRIHTQPHPPRYARRCK